MLVFINVSFMQLLRRSPPTYSVTVSYSKWCSAQAALRWYKVVKYCSLKRVLEWFLFCSPRENHFIKNQRIFFHLIPSLFNVGCKIQHLFTLQELFLFANKRHFEELPLCQKLNLLLDPAMSVPLHRPSLSMGINW